MTNETLTKYNSYTHNMWIENCTERDRYNEPLLRKEEYIGQNEKWLLDEFWLDWGHNRKWIQGEYKHEAS